jgi:hypothetical protein
MGKLPRAATYIAISSNRPGSITKYALRCSFCPFTHKNRCYQATKAEPKAEPVVSSCLPYYETCSKTCCLFPSQDSAQLLVVRVL